jgi:ribonuclease BN (tRNA processing enzyme)
MNDTSRVSVEVLFLGTGSASAPAGRSHTCIVLRAEGSTILLDCGGSALPAITRVLDPATIDAILISHLHGDHFGSVPFVLLHQGFAGRARPLLIGGPRGLQTRLRDLSLSLYADFYDKPLPFPTPFYAFDDGDRDIGPARVTPLAVVHQASSEPWGVRVRIGGKLIAFSGDAEWSDALPALADGADLFICEATTYALRWAGHLSVMELVERRAELRCKRLVLVHLGPEAVARRAEIALEVAEDGMSLTL